MLWLCACSVAAACGPPKAAPHHYGPLRTPIADPVSFPLRLIRDVPFAQVQIDDGPPIWFAIDTGSPISVFDSALTDRLRLHDQNQGMQVSGTTEGSFQTKMYAVGGVRIGGARLGDVTGIVTDVSAIGEHIGIPFGGIIGLAAFADYTLTLDYPNARGTLDHRGLPPPDGDEVLPLVLHNAHPSLTTAIGGAKTIVEIDSGSGYFMELASTVMARVKARGPLVVVGQAIGMTGMAQVKAARLDSTIAIGGHPVVDPMVFESADPSLETDGVARIGGPLLASFAVTFDQRLARVRFSRAGREPVRALPVRVSGVELVRKLTGWTVVGLVPGTSAATTGVQLGDRIVSLDGRPADAFDAGDWAAHDKTGKPGHLVVARGAKEIEVVVPTDELVH
jgi:hypothetical protein